MGGTFRELSEENMADEDPDQTFEAQDSGASLTFPQQAGVCRKGSHIVIKGRPCKVIEVTTSKTGKHGHAKCHFTGIDIFTEKKMEELVPSSHNLECPFIKREEWQLIDIDDDDYMTIMDEAGNQKSDLKLPAPGICDDISDK